MSKLSILFIKDSVAWTAQCLQYDIAAQGETIREAQEAFEYALVAEISYLAETQRTLDDLVAAPKHLWKSYDSAQDLQPISTKPFRLPSKILELLNGFLPDYGGLRVA